VALETQILCQTLPIPCKPEAHCTTTLGIINAVLAVIGVPPIVANFVGQEDKQFLGFKAYQPPEEPCPSESAPTDS
jgi:hypothetical protein